MGMTLVFRHGQKNGEYIARLSRRYHDLGGTDYEGFATLTMEEAFGLASSGIYFTHGQDIPEGTPDTTLSIALRKDPVPNARLWELTAQIEGRAPRMVGYLDCGMVRDLMASSVPLSFPNGAPDWEEVNELKMRLHVQDLRDQADALEASLDERAAKKEEGIEP